MSKKVTGRDVEDSAAYDKAKRRASEYAENPRKLDELVDRAKRKARAKKGPLSDVWDSLMAILRLLRAYAAGRYRDIPWGSLVSIIATVIYFVMPADLIPDFLLGWGFIDDAALVAFILNSLKSDIDNFLAWEAEVAAEESESPATLDQD